jgi:hypothetical protein
VADSPGGKMMGALPPPGFTAATLYTPFKQGTAEQGSAGQRMHRIRQRR